MDEALKGTGGIEGMPPKARGALKTLSHHLAGFRKESGEAAVSELLERVLERTGYLTFLEAEKTVEAQARIENIEEFFSVIKDFEESWQPGEGEDSILGSFLESISLMTNLDSWDNGSNVLTLMTLHTAKGLEFPTVYMVGMEEGVFPNGNVYTQDMEDLEEERRLCYVGITRAQEKITMTYTRMRRLYGSIQHNLPSRFLNEIPEEVFDTRSAFRIRVTSEVTEESYLDEETVGDMGDDEIRRRILFD